MLVQLRPCPNSPCTNATRGPESPRVRVASRSSSLTRTSDQPGVSAVEAHLGAAGRGLPGDGAALEVVAPSAGHRVLAADRIAERALLPAGRLPPVPDRAVDLVRPGARGPVDRPSARAGEVVVPAHPVRCHALVGERVPQHAGRAAELEVAPQDRPVDLVRAGARGPEDLAGAEPLVGTGGDTRR